MDLDAAFAAFDADAPEAAQALAAHVAAASPPPPAVRDPELVRAASALRGPTACFLGPYELVAPVGVGGVAAVYRARHVHPAFAARPTAVKVLQAAHRGDGRLLQLFRREADVLSLIQHANVVQTYDAGTQGEVAYLGMEYVPGADLSHLLWRAHRRGVGLPVPLLIYVAREVLAGLAYAHSLHDLHERPLHLVHRDVNPANVLLDYAGAVKLSDFGVASVRLGGEVQATELAGKAGYFAPEHLAGELATPAGDVYALGATLYEMLAGKPVFFGKGPAEVLERNRLGVLPPPNEFLAGHDPQLAAVVRQALAKAPAERFASAAAMSASLLPFTPDAHHARVLLGALMRQLFSAERQAELALARTLAYDPEAPPTPAPGAAGARVGEGDLPRAVDVVVADPVAQNAIVQLLDAEGYETHAFAGLDTWQRERTGLHPPAPVAIVDVRVGPQEAHRAAAQEMALRVRHLQVVALAGAFAMEAAEVAATWRARDLWVPPFAVERLREGVAEAYGAARAAADGASVAVPAQAPLRLAVLCIAAARPHVEAARAQAATRRDALTVVANFDAAQALIDEASFDLLVVQAGAGVLPPPDVEALARYRGSWGMGDVPCLWSLPAGAAAPVGAPLPPRSAYLPWRAPWREALAEAYASTVPGQARAFARYPVQIDVGMRVGGEVRAAASINVSRRGLLLRADVLPSLGTELMLVCTLPDGASVQVRGKALRVALPAAGATRSAAGPSEMGVALGPFVADGERVWLRWLRALAAAEAAAAVSKRGGWMARLFGRGAPPPT